MVERQMKMNNKYDKLKLENQLCFPLYAAAKEIVRQYKPFPDVPATLSNEKSVEFPHSLAWTIEELH